MQLHKIKTVLTRFVSQDSKPSADLKLTKKSKEVRCVWNLETEG